MESVHAAVNTVKSMTGFGEKTEEGTKPTDNTTGTTSTETTAGTTAHSTTTHGHNTGTEAAPTDSPAPANTYETTTEPEKKEEPKRDASEVQSKAQGSDPSLDGPAEAGTGKVKMTGTGAPGSHSALFGLTPDGHKETESNSKTTAPQPSSEDAKQNKKEEKREETGSRNDGGERVTEQMHDPRVDERGDK